MQRVGIAAATALVAAPACAADAPFSATDIFHKDNAAVIYTDCTDAREAADFLAKHAAVDCMNLKRATADRDRMRYLMLAAAGAAYLEAQNATSDDRQAAAIKRGQTYLSRIIPRSNRPGMVASYVPRRANASGQAVGQKPGAAQPMRQTVQAGVVMLGARPNWRFGAVAQALDEAYDALLHAPPADATAVEYV
ncbi:MAG: hypothetical protein ABR591_08920 [Candidatus Velthaea sp.]